MPYTLAQVHEGGRQAFRLGLKRTANPFNIAGYEDAARAAAWNEGFDRAQQVDKLEWAEVVATERELNGVL